MTEINRRDALKMAAGAAALGVVASAPAWAQTAPRVTFVLTNDIYKMSEEKGRGGLPRLAAVVRAERARNPNTIFAHAGDTMSPSLMSGFDQGAHMIDTFSAMTLDAFAPGNHEFDFGKDNFLKRMGEAKFPVYAANLRQADGSPVPGIKDNAIFEMAGVKIGVFGLTLQMTPSLSSPGDLKFEPEFETARAQNRALKQAGAEFVVAVVHSDRATDIRMFDARVADIILTGHDHDLRVVYDGKTAMVESGEDAQYVTVVEVALDVKVADGRRTIAWWPEFRIVDTATVTPDPEILAKVKGYEGELSRELDVPVATLAVAFDSRSATVRSQEAAVGNLIADAIRSATLSDIAIVNGGGIRGNRQYPSGHSLTRRDILSELPFGNRTAVTQITGAAVKAALENGVSQLENRGGRFPQVSGISFDIDPKQPVGQRIGAVMVGGTPIDDARTYTVATNDFMLRGGDGYTSLAGKVTATVDSGGSLLASDVMAYARKLGTVQVRPEGRIVFK
jgi:5'-nucleotidase/UDP-sugar diphosphatase